jgi:hypothetical protein
MYEDNKSQVTAAAERSTLISEKLEDFLIAEYSEVFQEFRRLRTEGISRLNFFVTLSTGILGGIIVLLQVSSLTALALQLITVIALSLLLLLGWDVFRYLISRDISSDFNMRAMGRIRRFFVDNNPMAVDYFLWNIDDLPAHYLGKGRPLSSIISTIVYFWGALLALDVGALLSVFTNQVEVIFGVGFICFVASIPLLRSYAKKRLLGEYEKALASSKFRDIPKT